jgi:hypothetical protein
MNEGFVLKVFLTLIRAINLLVSLGKGFFAIETVRHNLHYTIT